MSGEVLSDPDCGEPIAWARVGEPVIGHEWTEHGWVAVTERLTPAEAVQKYGPIAEVVLGPKRGFESVTYGVPRPAADLRVGVRPDFELETPVGERHESEPFGVQRRLRKSPQRDRGSARSTTSAGRLGVIIKAR